MSKAEQTKRGRGRPAGSKNKTKAEAAPARQAAPKKPTRPDKVVEHDRIRVEDLTDDQHLGLMLQHAAKIASVETAMQKAKDEVKKARDLARAELGPDALHEIKFYARLQTDEGQADFRRKAEMQIRVARWAQMPVGHIDDLFPTDRMPVSDKARAEGKLAGLAGDDRAPPSHMTHLQQQEWLHGHAEGQEVIMAGWATKEAPPSQAFDAMRPEETEVAVGPQLDAMAGEYGDSGRDYQAEGLAAFNRGDAGKVPDHVPADGHDKWLEGWDRASVRAGQNRNIVHLGARG